MHDIFASNLIGYSFIKLLGMFLSTNSEYYIQNKKWLLIQWYRYIFLYVNSVFSINKSFLIIIIIFKLNLSRIMIVEIT